LPHAAAGDGLCETVRHGEEETTMSEPTSHTEAAGEGVSDEEMVRTVAEQTDSASENADTAGKDWNGDPSEAPAPADQG
jgi:NACalpha-BTF3-like transcription factor